MIQLRALAALLALALLVICPARGQAEECRYDFDTKAFVGDCGGDSTGGSTLGGAQNCDTQEAQIAVDWVFQDVGALRTFQRFYGEGNSPLDSVIGAQGHNPGAQANLEACSGWAANYIATEYAGVIAGTTPPPTTGPQTCSAPPAGLCYNGCEISCPAGRAARCEPGITWNEQCWRGPKCECVRP